MQHNLKLLIILIEIINLVIFPFIRCEAIVASFLAKPFYLKLFRSYFKLYDLQI